MSTCRSDTSHTLQWGHLQRSPSVPPGAHAGAPVARRARRQAHRQGRPSGARPTAEQPQDAAARRPPSCSTSASGRRPRWRDAGAAQTRQRQPRLVCRGAPRCFQPNSPGALPCARCSAIPPHRPAPPLRRAWLVHSHAPGANGCASARPEASEAAVPCGPSPDENAGSPKAAPGCPVPGLSNAPGFRANGAPWRVPYTLHPWQHLGDTHF